MAEKVRDLMPWFVLIQLVLICYLCFVVRAAEDRAQSAEWHASQITTIVNNAQANLHTTSTQNQRELIRIIQLQGTAIMENCR